MPPRWLECAIRVAWCLGLAGLSAPARPAGLVLAPKHASAESGLRVVGVGEVAASDAIRGGELVLSSGGRRVLEPLGDGFDALIRQSAQRYGQDADLLRAIIQVESGFDPLAVSGRGAIGLMQVMPATAAELGLADPARALLEPASNIDAGTRQLRELLRRFGGDLPLALAAYNAGTGAVERHAGALPPYPETRRYVDAVLAVYRQFAMQGEGAPASARL